VAKIYATLGFLNNSLFPTVVAFMGTVIADLHFELGANKYVDIHFSNYTFGRRTKCYFPENEGETENPKLTVVSYYALADNMDRRRCNPLYHYWKL
jgi:hypothetical protein